MTKKTGAAVDPVSAAVILADKTDVRRNRVRNKIKATFDKHDRVNYAATSSSLEINPDKKLISLNIELGRADLLHHGLLRNISPAMLMCRRAAEILGLKFRVTANGHKVG